MQSWVVLDDVPLVLSQKCKMFWQVTQHMPPGTLETVFFLKGRTLLNG